MITTIPDFLRYFDAVHRRALRDIAALPPEADGWAPATGTGEGAWNINTLVGHMAGSRLYFASAYRGDGWISPQPPDTTRRDRWLRALEESARNCMRRSTKTPDGWLQRKVQMIDTDAALSGWRVLMMMLEHEIDHRSQIDTYAGLNGWPVPDIYGRSAETILTLQDAERAKHASCGPARVRPSSEGPRRAFGTLDVRAYRRIYAHGGQTHVPPHDHRFDDEALYTRLKVDAARQPSPGEGHRRGRAQPPVRGRAPPNGTPSSPGPRTAPRTNSTPPSTRCSGSLDSGERQLPHRTAHDDRTTTYAGHHPVAHGRRPSSSGRAATCPRTSCASSRRPTTSPQCHDGQMRLTGDPYIVHPLDAAMTVASLQLDAAAIAPRSCTTSRRTAASPTRSSQRASAPTSRELVDGVTKLDQHHLAVAPDERHRRRGSPGREPAQDVPGDGGGHPRRHHQAGRPPAQHAHARRASPRRSSGASRARRWRSTRRSPTASASGRSSGSSRTSRSATWSRRRYKEIARPARSRSATSRERYVAQVEKILRDELEAPRHRGRAHRAARSTSTASTRRCRSTPRWAKTFNEIYDLLALRVLVDNVADCYNALGVVHGLWRPDSRPVRRLHRQPARRASTSRCTRP